MSQRNDTIIATDDECRVVQELRKGPIVVQVSQYEKKCGHPGFLVDVFHCGINGELEPLQVACFGWEDMGIALELMKDVSREIEALEELLFDE